MAGLVDRDSDKRYWSDDEVYKLIRLYEEEEVLYNTTARDYRNKTMRRAAEQRIAANFKNCTAMEVTRKWRILMARYYKIRRDRARPGGVYVKWKYFSPLQFIGAHAEHAKKQGIKTQGQSADEQNEEGSEEEEDDGGEAEYNNAFPDCNQGNAFQETQNQDQVWKSNTTNTTYQNNKEDTSVATSCDPKSTAKRKDPPSSDLDDCTAFGKFVAAELRNQDPQTRKTMKSQISGILLQFQ